MGYYTDFKLTMAMDKVSLTETAVVKDITAFFLAKGIDIGEHTAGRLVTELARHFKPISVNEKDILDALNDISSEGFGKDFSLGGATWYEHDNDMRKLSKRFPTVTFTLSGYGEEQGDIWKKTYHDGVLLKEQKAKIVFADNDED